MLQYNMYTLYVLQSIVEISNKSSTKILIYYTIKGTHVITNQTDLNIITSCCILAEDVPG